jgi:hypothetical protein
MKLHQMLNKLLNMCLMVLRVREIGQPGQGKEIEDTNSKLCFSIK